MKLGLGTVQFGLEYGVTNVAGQPVDAEIRQILACAATQGVRVLDTAAQYGRSEARLGALLEPNHAFRIVTKTPSFTHSTITTEDVACLESTFLASLDQLRATSVYGLLLHSAKDLRKSGADQLFEAMEKLQKQGKVAKIGVSVYSGEDVAYALDRFGVQLVQMPVNILDQRWLRSDLPVQLQKGGVELHARSIFLQGVLLSDPDTLPPFFDAIKPHLRAMGLAIRERGLTPLQAALGFVRDLAWVDVALCGVVSLAQLHQIVQGISAPFDGGFLQAFACQDPAILDPSQWVLR